MSTSWFYTLLSRVTPTPLFRMHSFLCSLCSPEVYGQARVGASGRRNRHSWYQQLCSGRSLFPLNLKDLWHSCVRGFLAAGQKKKPKLMSFYVQLVGALCPPAPIVPFYGYWWRPLITFTLPVVQKISALYVQLIPESGHTCPSHGLQTHVYIISLGLMSVLLLWLMSWDWRLSFL